MKKWYQYKVMPWVFLAAVLMLGVVVLIGIAIVGAVGQGTPIEETVMTVGVVWVFLGVFIVPTAIAVSIVWAVKIRDRRDPADLEAERARAAVARAERAAFDSDRRAERDAARAADQEAQRQTKEERKARRSEKAAASEAQRATRSTQRKAQRTARKESAEKRRRVADDRAAAAERKSVRKPRTPTAEPRPVSVETKTEAVQVAFCKNGLETNPWKTYTYAWVNQEPPQIGSYAFVPTDSGRALVEIIALGRGGYDLPLSKAARPATPQEVARYAARNSRRGVRFQ